MDIFSSFATDETLETGGTWFPLSKTASVLVAREKNSKWKAYVQTVFKSNPLEGLPDKEANALAEGIMLDAAANTILLSWKGLEFKGSTAEVSVAMARTLLEIKDFRAKIEGFSASLEAYRVKEATAQGNA